MQVAQALYICSRDPWPFSILRQGAGRKVTSSTFQSLRHLVFAVPLQPMLGVARVHTLLGGHSSQEEW